MLSLLFLRHNVDKLFHKATIIEQTLKHSHELLLGKNLNGSSSVWFDCFRTVH